MKYFIRMFSSVNENSCVTFFISDKLYREIFKLQREYLWENIVLGSLIWDSFTCQRDNKQGHSPLSKSGDRSQRHLFAIYLFNKVIWCAYHAPGSVEFLVGPLILQRVSELKWSLNWNRTLLCLICSNLLTLNITYKPFC